MFKMLPLAPLAGCALFVSAGGAWAQDGEALAVLPQDLTPWGMFLSADIVVKAVIVGLAVASIVTWTVYAMKTIELTAAKRSLLRALALMGEARSLDALAEHRGIAGTLAQDFVAAAKSELDIAGDATGAKERIASRLERLRLAASRRLGQGTGVLATIGATAPFVGLFGTVWGIMNSFVGITREQTTNLAVVAPGIAEALLATAIGLVAAIPAVVIYNHFSRRTAVCRALMGDIAAAVQRAASRDLDAAGPRRAAAE